MTHFASSNGLLALLSVLSLLFTWTASAQPSYTLDYSLSINDISGNILVLGRPDEDTPVPNPTGVPILDTGAAYVFVRTGATWNLQQRLAVAGLRDLDQFGKAVAISGDTIAVASDERSPGSAERIGAIYVFRLSAGSWTLQVRLVPTQPASIRSGFPVIDRIRLSGDWLFATSAGSSVNASTPRAGLVFAYKRSGTTWTASTIVAPDPSTFDAFGLSLDVAGSQMCIGAAGVDVNGIADRGAVYLFDGDANGWRFNQRLTATGTDPEQLGSSCAIDGANMAASTRVNRAHVFSRASGQWRHEAVLTPQHPVFESTIDSIELTGDVVLLGLSSVRSVPQLDEDGVVDTFVKTNGQWTPGTTLRGLGRPAMNMGLRYFGAGLALDGRTLLVSAPCFSVSQCISRVYIFDLPAALPPPTLNVLVAGNVATLAWSDESGTASAFDLGVGSSPGQSNIANIAMGAATSVAGPIPSGQRFFARVTAKNGFSIATSQEVSFGVDVDPPGPPVLTIVQGSVNPIALRWSAGAGPAPTGFALIAGTQAGAGDLGTFAVGSTTSVTAPAPVGIPVFVRVRASNGAGSAVSNEVVFTVTNRAPAAPVLAASRVTGATVELTWSAAAASYEVLARLTPTGAVVARVPVAASSLMVPSVGAGTYYVTVVSVEGGLTSAESNQVTVVVQ